MGSTDRPVSPRFLVLAEQRFDTLYAKTAICAIRYLPGQIAAVIDSNLSGRSVEDVLGFGGDIPIVSNLEEGLARDPDALLIGIAPAGGRLPAKWVELCVGAAEAGLDLWSGLHGPLAADPAVAAAARAAGIQLHDLRVPSRSFPVATGAALDVDALVILTVGSDCAVGKLTASLELAEELKRSGVAALMVPTGQTGILIAGWGVAVDAVPSDFVSGATEWLVLEGASRGGEVLLVEGQGALSHPGYSGVTLGLLHGSLPHGMILCHEPGREHHIGGGLEWTAVPELPAVVEMYEAAASWIRPAKVLGIALNTSEVSEREAHRLVDEARDATGLPAADPVRFGAGSLTEPILELRSAV